MSRQRTGPLASTIVSWFILLCLPAVPPLVAQDVADDRTESGTPKTVIEGRVVDPEGNPVTDATVLALSSEAKPVQRPGGLMPFAGTERKKHAVAAATTDESGLFLLEVEGPAPFMLRASAEGFAPSRVVEAGAADSPLLRLTSGWTIRGRVFDRTTGGPVAGAEVKATSIMTGGFADEDHGDQFVEETTSDAEGRFEFTRLEPNFYRVTAVADGYSQDLVSQLEVGLHDTPPEEVFLYLMRGVTLTGTVRTDDGSAIEGATVRVRPERRALDQMGRWARSGGFSSKTGEDGGFTIRGIPATPACVLEVRHDDYAPATVAGIRVKEGMTSAPIAVVLTPGTSLTARLVADGQPYEGKVSVSATYSLPGSHVDPRVVRGPESLELEQGTLTARRLPVGKARLAIEVPGFKGVVRNEVSLPADRPLDLGEILLEAGLRITGRVLDDKGEPLEGAEVEAFSFASGGMVRTTAESNADGTFTLGVEKEIAYTVSAEADGYGRGSVKEIEPGGEAVEIRLRKAGVIRGRVVAGDPPEGIGGFTVESQGSSSDLPFQLRMVGLDRSRMTFRDPAGEFVIAGLSEDTFKLKIEATGFMPARVEDVEVTAGETTDLGLIRLERGATLYGTVRDKSSGRPVGGAAVKLEPPGVFNMRGFMEMGVAARTTGPDGRFSISGLAPGKHTIRVEHERFATRKEKVVVADGVPPADLTVELTSGGAIEGTYRDKEGNPVMGGMVIAMQGVAPDPNTMASADEIGHFRIDNLPPGSYRVMALPSPDSAGGDQAAMLAQMQMQTVEVTDGKTSIVNIPAEAGTIVVNGTVRKGAERVEARLVWVRMAPDDTTPEDFAMAASDESGAFQIRLAGPGEYRVSIQPMGDTADLSSPGMSLKVEIPDEAEVTQDLVISETVLSGVVLDADTGERLPEVQVMALEHREDQALRESTLASATETDEEGRYELEGLGEDEYRLVFSKQGYEAQIVGPFELEDDEEERLDASLLPASDVTVRVTDRDGNPVEGAFVTALDFPALVVAGTTAETDMNGQVVLKGLPQGAHELGVVVAGYAPAVVRDVLVPMQDPEPVRIQLTPGAALIVRVVDVEERPVAKAGVRIRQENGTDLTSMVQFAAVFEGRWMITGPDGSLRIPNLEPGRYELEIRWRDRVVKDKVRVEAGEENEVEVALR